MGHSVHVLSLSHTLTHVEICCYCSLYEKNNSSLGFLQVSVHTKSSSITDGTAKLISDSILVALQQMRGDSYTSIAEGIVPRINTLTSGDWHCIVGERGGCGWQITCCKSNILCTTSDIQIFLFTT